MVRTWVAVLVADLIMASAVLLVLQDVQMRIDCSLPGCDPYVTRASPGFAYSVLTKSFSVVVGGRTLQSPPTLDWVQLLVVALVALNAWYGYRAMRPRGRNAASPGPLAP
jgi:hypothetical protein